MFDTFLRDWGLPVFGLLFALIGYLYFSYAGRQLDRKYGRQDRTPGS